MLRKIFFASSLPDALMPRVLLNSYVIIGIGIFLGMTSVGILSQAGNDSIRSMMISNAIIFTVMMTKYCSAGFSYLSAAIIGMGATVFFKGAFMLFSAGSFVGFVAMIVGFVMVNRYYSGGPVDLRPLK